MTAEYESESAVTEAAMAALRELLERCETYGVGITFQPDIEGWSVGYLQGTGGGDLARAYDLETAAKAALRPLDDLVDKSILDHAEPEA